MDRDRAIDYINELLNSEYDLMEDRKLDSSNPCLYDKEATESELEEIVNAQDFMTHILKGGQLMEDLINEEILERLYEEALDELSLKEFSYWLRSATSNKSYKPNSKEFIQERAVELAKKRFEEQSQ